jgi:hypothetical protein
VLYAPGGGMKDFCFLGRCLRVFWRGRAGFKYPLPYAFQKWGLYAFGAFLVGFMYWPKQAAERGRRAA